MTGGWIGVDLDGTLAMYESWKGPTHIGKPIKPMVDRVKTWLKIGEDVRIFTARVGPQKEVNDTIRSQEAIVKWCKKHIGQELPITATKDYRMLMLYDDRCVTIETNTGKILST